MMHRSMNVKGCMHLIHGYQKPLPHEELLLGTGTSTVHT